MAASLTTHYPAYMTETQSQMLLAVLHPDGALSMWVCSQVGARCLHACQSMRLHNPPFSPAALLGARLGVWRPAGQAVPDRLTIIAALAPGAPGQHEQRLDLQVHQYAADPLLTLCLRALRRTLLPTLYLDLLALLGGDNKFGTLSAAVPNLISNAACRGVGGVAAAPRWTRFCAQMHSWFGIALPQDAAAEGQGSLNPWGGMLRSDEHHREGSRAACHCLLPMRLHGPPKVLPRAHPMCAPLPRALQEACFLALHADYEGLKLDCLAWAQLPRLASLLAPLASQLNMQEHATLYARDLGPAVEEHISLSQKRRIASHLAAARSGDGASGGRAPLLVPFNALESLHKTLARTATLRLSPATPPSADEANTHCVATPTTLSDQAPIAPIGAGAQKWPDEVLIVVFELYAIIAAAKKGLLPAQPPTRLPPPAAPPLVVGNIKESNVATSLLPTGCPEQLLAERLVLTMVRRGLGLKHLEVLPLGVAVPLQDAIRACRHCSPPNWPTAAYRLIGREDLARQHQEQRSTAMDCANAEWPPVMPPASPGSAQLAADDLDGMQTLVARSVLRFGRDLRLAEERKSCLTCDVISRPLSCSCSCSLSPIPHQVQRLLCSSRAMALRLGSGGPELTDHELIHEQQSRLVAASLSVLAAAAWKARWFQR